MKKRASGHERVVAVKSVVAPLQRRVRATLPSLAISLGNLVGVGSDGEPWIDVPAHGLSRVVARSTTALHASMIGRQVLVTFVDGQPDQPVVIGVVRTRGDAPNAAPPADGVVDGERVVITGRREIVLRCGKASIALDADGRVVIKGANLLATAAGTHRIRGGVVQIN